MGVMNTVTSTDSSYYAANTNEKTEKGPCLAMTPYGIIGAERVKFPATFALFSVVRLRYAHAQLSSLYLLSTFGAFHMTKNTRLSTPAQLQCSRSGAWEPGNEASQHVISRVQVLLPDQ